MGKRRHLNHAPITEAIIDFGARFEKPLPEDRFSDIGAAIESDYPNREERFAVQMQYNVKERTGHTDGTLEGFLYQSADGQQAAQSRRGGFTFSRLKPYRSWDAMLEEAWRLWEIYVEKFAPSRVTRLATRFINRLEFPVEGFDFDDYITIAPRLPASSPQTLIAFSSSFTIPMKVPKTVATVRTVFNVIPTTSVPMILDIDVIRNCDLSATDARGIRDALNELRPMKNDIFFNSLTDKALEVFE